MNPVSLLPHLVWCYSVPLNANTFP